MDSNKYITQFRVQELWKRYNVNWTSIHEDVNVIVGINGCGKTTLLDLLYDYYTGKKLNKNLVESVEGNPITSPVTYIRSFDVPFSGKKTESPLLQELKYVINQNGEGTSFFDYRMRMLNYADQAETIQRRINQFFKIVNVLFQETGKEIAIDVKNNTLAFRIRGTEKFLTANGKLLVTDKDQLITTSGDKVTLEQLSSGEKQVLLILTTVFLQEENPAVLLLDEPEISLDIRWQDKLVELIRQLNPHCQVILTTHSPNIFANGWEDKLVFLEQLEEKI